MTESIVRRVTVQALTGLSKSSIYDRMNPNSKYHDPSFPLPVKIGARAAGWKMSELQEWISQRTRVDRKE
ncbi:helix-turn-helix transcriptional regulator [Silvimonas amylolytica]|uniref:Transcriptional regulator, AlpA family n=1 Tax=Silvimonas amylolytica TaxID=449663 RepID=A0ABQ2PMH8_9NEIS|nr:AlpA family phage regulatory protein [Silvimonas amylolytica]GGP26810.1 hypothetical protein GCM10010971_26290 [Silvimonas amylolytica]